MTASRFGKPHGRCAFCPDAVTHIVRTANMAYRTCTPHVKKVRKPTGIAAFPTSK
jgi:histone acetyltransferase (RNA polymerase elongator complex component)